MNRPSIVVVFACLVAGCEQVQVEIDTHVHDDGSFKRTIVYRAKSDVLQAEYVLPSGPGWKVSTEQKDDEIVYKASGQFWGLETDYIKRDGRTPPQRAMNRISIRVSPTECSYRETFSDTADAQQLRALYEEESRRWVREAMGRLRGTLLTSENPLTIERMEDEVTTEALANVGLTWSELESVESEEDSSYIQDVFTRHDDWLVRSMDRAWRNLGHHYPGRQMKQAIRHVLSETAAASSDGHGGAAAASPEEPWGERFQARLAKIGGAHASRISRYHFRVAVELPCDILTSNAIQADGRTAEWTFDDLFFLLKDYTMHAEGKPAG